ncbi:tRNA (adenosine(37)-N6)-threonylcarbamoyltransferase complex dimerization subunit type 1 TsaB [Octadecabacter sp. G9-8]|uniref:tRNA (Adenosine(37)-N6)-threonylcarbamoyltransferase complex dimerization subunit type 1 TsaB n=1 Tax=Octadecabacter dasysiphoniae TaxID=2909341 RepID=A0ABS9CRQ2_9RHOB|nr:tRNA (adenosine(37)-N6)-threonylcarbamoyltransferase complex dimerization subunit type 1 TsaB [Octadecabacter dasysiphoniae]MCF2869621.1 tRNA (adenosine(37)-N6)-threonylcarbamoyltransferase complex dimerization subunit type 1 TsaB [Octadecabacter dasysiphoniae]
MTDQTLLAFDTSGPFCASALLRDGQITTRVEDMARGQGERLMVLLEDLLREQNTTWADLDVIGVGVGPGNFTGIRISVSAARGLALGLGIKAVGVSLFDTTQQLANWAQTKVPAPRDQFYMYDPDKMAAPILAQDGTGPFANAADHSVADHVAAIARIAAQRAGADTPRPAPMYVKPPDAAPPREQPPVILP